MLGSLLTQNSTPIFKWIVWLLGKIMNYIFEFLDLIGIPNTALAISLFTVVCYLLMMPMTVKSQKFSKLSQKMNPEIQAIRNKYNGRKDQESMMAMNEETNAVYAKYGVSPSGGCLQLLIQMPILFALYRVIYSMPAYIDKMGNAFRELAHVIFNTDKAEFITSSAVTTVQQVVNQYGGPIKTGTEESTIINGIVDVLNKLSSFDLTEVANHYNLFGIQYDGMNVLTQGDTLGLIDKYNNLFGLNIANSPKIMISTQWAADDRNWWIIIGAIMFPILSAVTQWINTLLQPQQPKNDKKDPNDQGAMMQSYMKGMNYFMPLMSAYFSFILPAAMSFYWIVGAIFRSVQQVVINKNLDKIDIEAEMEKNMEKYAEKQKRRGKYMEGINANAQRSTKSIQSRASQPVSTRPATKTETTNTPTSSSSKPGSLSARANLVRDFNEKNNK